MPPAGLRDEIPERTAGRIARVAVRHGGRGSVFRDQRIRHHDDVHRPIRPTRRGAALPGAARGADLSGILGLVSGGPRRVHLAAGHGEQRPRAAGRGAVAAAAAAKEPATAAGVLDAGLRDVLLPAVRGALRWLREDDLFRVPMAWAASSSPATPCCGPARISRSSTCCSRRCCWNSSSAAWWRSMSGGIGRRAAIGSLIMGLTGFAAGTLALAARGEPFPPGWTRVLIYGSSSALVVAGIDRAGTFRPAAGTAAAGRAGRCVLFALPVACAGDRRRGPGVASIGRRAAPGLHVAALVSGFAVALAAGVASFHLIEMPLLRVSRRLARVATAAPIR